MLINSMLLSGREHEFTGKLIKIDSAGEETPTRSLNLFIFQYDGEKNSDIVTVGSNIFSVHMFQ